MKKLVIILICFTIFGTMSVNKVDAQIMEAFKLLHYTKSIYQLGKEVLEDFDIDLGSLWNDDGYLSLTTDRKQGVTVYIHDEKLADVYPHKHANYKVSEGTYTMIVRDKKRGNKMWVKTFRIKEDEITEITIKKDGWNKRGRSVR